MQEVNDYNKRFNYLTKRVRCENCPNTSVSDSDNGAALEIRKDIASMLRQEMSNSQIIDNLQKQHSVYVTYDPGMKIKLYLVTISVLFMITIIFFAIKYLY